MVGFAEELWGAAVSLILTDILREMPYSCFNLGLPSPFPLVLATLLLNPLSLRFSNPFSAEPLSGLCFSLLCHLPLGASFSPVDMSLVDWIGRDPFLELWSELWTPDRFTSIQIIIRDRSGILRKRRRLEHEIGLHFALQRGHVRNGTASDTQIVREAANIEARTHRQSDPHRGCWSGFLLAGEGEVMLSRIIPFQ